MPLACFLFENRSYPGPGSGGKSNGIFPSGSNLPKRIETSLNTATTVQNEKTVCCPN
jgi:hypothetical protein